MTQPHPTVLREVLADTERKHATMIEAIQATLATLKIETGPKK
jgi:hypothetical protein